MRRPERPGFLLNENYQHEFIAYLEFNIHNSGPKKTLALHRVTIRSAMGSI
jgi:hypothetical protein